MGLLSDIFDELFGSANESKESEAIKRRKALRNRVCRIEEIEPRELLSATPYEPPDAIHVGVVYHEEYSKGSVEDRGGDTFVVSWNGGADGTTLDKIVIDLRTGNAAETMYFNVDRNAPQGTNGGAFPFTVVSDGETDIVAGDVEYTLSNNGQVLEIRFKNFTAGKVFKFKIDVNLKDSNKIIPLVPGMHFEGSLFEAVFSSEKYEQLTYQTDFSDDFADPKQLNLSVPPDEYFENPDETRAAMTAGVVEKIAQRQIPLSGSLSGHVYEDVNDDGIFQKGQGEKGIADVWLELLVLNKNNVYESTNMKVRTNADGYYIFDKIEGGRTYKIVEVQPDGYADGKDTPGTIDGVSVGRAIPTDEIGEIHIGAKEHGVDYNFGELKRASLSGYVYHDRNNDGVRDSGEEGIANVKIKLQVLDSQGRYVDVPDAVTRTDANGKYVFENLDPFRSYRVVEEQPDKWSDGLETVGTVGGIVVGSTRQNDTIEGIVLGFDQHGVEYNFGEYKTGSISGVVYEDDNDNGRKDPNEPGIDGVTIWLCVVDENGNKVNIEKTVTKDGGKYSFDDLEPGKTYCVTEVNPEGYCDGETSVGTIVGRGEVGSVNKEVEPGFDQIHDIYIGSGDEGINYDFGENRRGSLGGYVYVDANDNGIRDFGEKGIAGVTLTLWVWNEDQNRYVATSRTAVTDENGYYEFDGLCPFRKYRITEKQPKEYSDGRESIGTIDGRPVGVLPEIDDDSISEILLPPGGVGKDYNFGELSKPGSISGYVYTDLNKNGVRESGEKGIEGVTLTLWKLVGGDYVETGRTTKTDSKGYYIFDNLDPNETYMIRETQPKEYDDGRESIGTIGGKTVGILPKVDRDLIYGIELPSGGKGVHYNFGEYVRADTKGSISGYVYTDLNKNGVRESGEKGIAGVTLTLWKLVGGDYVETGRTTKTDSKGYYIFDNLDPNETYMIRETQPKEYDDGRESIGTIGGKTVGILPKVDRDLIYGIELPPGGKGVHYNFGELVKPVDPPLPPKGSLSGYVYTDLNKNGVRESGEKGIEGVTLTLWKLVGGDYVETGRTTKTDSKGYYIFDNLDPNETYMIRETQPAGYDDGRESIGTIGGKTVGILPKVDRDLIYGIELPPGGKGVHYNFGELVKPVEPTPYVPPATPITPTFPSPNIALGQPASGGGMPVWQPPILSETLRPGYGGGGLPSGYSWHLSVVNAGYPRDTAGAEAAARGLTATNAVTQRTMILDDTSDQADADAKTRYVSVAWTPMPMNQSVWYVRDKKGNVKKRFTFGPEGARPLAADFSGDGLANLAVYHNGNWYIDLNGDGTWDEEDLWCELGTASDMPIVGDWDGDGKADIGVFGPQWAGDAAIVADEPGLPSALNRTVTARPKNMPPDVDIAEGAHNVRAMKHSRGGQVRLDVIDHVFQYGGEGDQAFSGDFSGDGITKIGVYRGGKWYIDYNGNGQWDSDDIFVDSSQIENAEAGIPVVGDFDGDGIDNIGLYVNGVWHLDTTGDFRFDTVIEFGQAGDYPVVGDFDGDGLAQLSVYRSANQDSLIAMPGSAPAVSVGASNPMYADNAEPGARKAETTQKFAAPFASPSSDDAADSSTGQGTLPEELQRHGRSMRTPHTNAPLHRHR